MSITETLRQRISRKGADGQMVGPKEAASSTALIVLDMISDFDFEDGDKLYTFALKAAENIAELKARLRAAGVPVIYVNDNYGKWSEDFGSFVKEIGSRSEKGKKIIELIGPSENDYHILKPQRSAFYETPLGVLLLTLNVSNLIITGVTTDICVLFTAHDAYMRGYELTIPSDCSAATEETYHENALQLLGRVTYADVRPAKAIDAA